jgi:hypothetical protein
MNPHRIDSPDGGHTAVLCDLGEIRFGPPYFALEIDNWSIAGRIFGGSARWSEDSTMFAIQEWLTTDYAEGPVTQLTVFDAARKRQCALARADKGYIVVTDFPPNLSVSWNGITPPKSKSPVPSRCRSPDSGRGSTRRSLQKRLR